MPTFNFVKYPYFFMHATNYKCTKPSSSFLCLNQWILYLYSTKSYLIFLFFLDVGARTWISAVVCLPYPTHFKKKKLKAIRKFGIKLIVEELKVEEEGFKQKKRFYLEENPKWSSDFGFEEINIEYFDICLGVSLNSLLFSFFFACEISQNFDETNWYICGLLWDFEETQLRSLQKNVWKKKEKV